MSIIRSKCIEDSCTASDIKGTQRRRSYFWNGDMSSNNDFLTEKYLRGRWQQNLWRIFLAVPGRVSCISGSIIFFKVVADSRIWFFFHHRNTVGGRRWRNKSLICKFDKKRNRVGCQISNYHVDGVGVCINFWWSQKRKENY